MTDKKVQQTIGQALGELSQVIGLSATQRRMELLQVPGGSGLAKWEDVNKAMVTAIRSFGELISAALNATAPAVEDAPEWRALKEKIVAISCAVNEGRAEK